MKVDTGADVTTVPETVYRYKQDLSSSPPLSESDCILRGPDGRALPTVGSFHTKMAVKPTPDNTTQQTVYVVRGLQIPLLG